MRSSKVVSRLPALPGNPVFLLSWPLTVCARLSLVIAALAIDYAVVPSLYNGSTLLAATVFLALVYIGRKQFSEEAFPAFSLVRVLAFVGFHVAIVLAARTFAPELASAARAYTWKATASASLKLLPLLPTLVLFPTVTWRRMARNCRAELVAAAVVLLTFFPFRIFNLAWPVYSDWLAHVVSQVTAPLLPGIYYIPGPDPLLVGPKLDVKIGFYCSGIEGVYLFDLLFGLIVLMEWNRLRKLRTLLCYAAGLALILLSNLGRLILLVLAGNLISPAILEGGLHRHAGWIFFAIVFLVFLYFSYGWMRSPAREQAVRAC